MLQSKCQLDVLIENHGRVNYATLESGTLNTERKGNFSFNLKLEFFNCYPEV